jgi:TatD DNase family protein
MDELFQGPEQPALIDIGVNLLHPAFDADREEVAASAASAGVRPLVITGTSAEGSREALDYARRYPGRLYATAGIHPHEARRSDPASLAALGRLCGEGAIALGECGLDYNRDFSPRHLQRECFEAQVRLACERGVPLFLHERDAFEDFYRVLEKYRSSLSPAVLHCFTGTEGELEAALEMGLYIGITGWVCDERRGRHLLPLLGRIPPDRLMLETDAPFLVPRNLRGVKPSARNEPKYLPHVAAFVAAALGKSPAVLAAETTANARRFFRLPD